MLTPFAGLAAAEGARGAGRNSRCEGGDAPRVAARLRDAECLFRDFCQLTPYPYRPFVKSFSTFEAYERWKRTQTNPWYR